jgi:nucleoside triphosphate pyrophosphatase
MRRSIWLADAPLLLASTSATRRLLLESAGLPVEIEAPGLDERALEAEVNGAPDELSRRLAAAKALAVSRRQPGRVVVGADQILELAGEILHKPRDRADALRQLQWLAGRTHSLETAFAIARDGRIVHAGSDRARLTMRPLAAPAIERYLDLLGDAVTETVGCYRLETLGAHLFDRVEGDHATILGLPLLRVLAALRDMALLAF